MTIELSKEQYVFLLELAFLGEWVANSFRVERLPEYHAVESMLNSLSLIGTMMKSKRTAFETSESSKEITKTVA